MLDVWPTYFKCRPSYFKPSEFGKCADDERLDTRIRAGCKMDEHFIWKLELLRCRIGRPLIVNMRGGYRNEAVNKLAGGAKNSAHRLGRAADISTRGWEPWQRKQLVSEARALGITGVGIGKTFIHLDDVTKNDGPYTRPLAWTYTDSGKVAVLGKDIPDALY